MTMIIMVGSTRDIAVARAMQVVYFQFPSSRLRFSTELEVKFPPSIGPEIEMEIVGLELTYLNRPKILFVGLGNLK